MPTTRDPNHESITEAAKVMTVSNHHEECRSVSKLYGTVTVVCTRDCCCVDSLLSQPSGAGGEDKEGGDPNCVRSGSNRREEIEKQERNNTDQQGMREAKRMYTALDGIEVSGDY